MAPSHARLSNNHVVNRYRAHRNSKNALPLTRVKFITFLSFLLYIYLFFFFFFGGGREGRFIFFYFELVLDFFFQLRKKQYWELNGTGGSEGKETKVILKKNEDPN